MSDHTRANSQSQEIPYGYCHCGCGQLAPLHKKTRSDQGHIKGEPAKYIHGHNARVYAPPEFKFCSICQETKPLTDFYQPKDRRASAHCKACGNAVSRAYHLANREKRLDQISEYRAANKEKLSEAERLRRADPAYREQCSAELKEWRERNKEYVAAYNRSMQVKARNRVNKLILSGKLPRPDILICAHCAATQAQHYHHYAGYEHDNWLDVIALCTECHGKAHRLDG